MKNAAKLYLIVSTLICATLYSAEQRTPDAGEMYFGKMIRDFLVKTDNLDPEKLKEHQNEITKRTGQELAKTMVDAAIHWNKPVDQKTIAIADPDTATLAREHNQRLIAQLQQNQQQK